MRFFCNRLCYYNTISAKITKMALISFHQITYNNYHCTWVTFSNKNGMIDESSMLCQCKLYFIDKRLQQIMANTESFGGLVVVLAGDGPCAIASREREMPLGHKSIKCIT